MCSIDYWDWVGKFKPITNHFDKTVGIDGYLFLPFGNQWGFVSRFDSKYLWSLIVTDFGDDTVWEITSGIHMVNIQGCLVTEVPYTKDTTIAY